MSIVALIVVIALTLIMATMRVQGVASGRRWLPMVDGSTKTVTARCSAADLPSSSLPVLAVFNLIRMVVYLVGADLYTIRKGPGQTRVLLRLPPVSVPRGADAQRGTDRRTDAGSICSKVDYEPLQIIVVDDGSTDDTAERIARFKMAHDHDGASRPSPRTNGGKAHALNTAIQTRATGELVMCLDGDSILAPDAVTKSVAYFADERVVATASNVNIMPERHAARPGPALRVPDQPPHEEGAQHLQRRVHHRRDRLDVPSRDAGRGRPLRHQHDDRGHRPDDENHRQEGQQEQTGGVRRTTRSSTPRRCRSFEALVQQRSRWKYGRTQSFFKYWRLFFSLDRKHSNGLTWFMMPFALFQEVMELLEPLIDRTHLRHRVSFTDSPGRSCQPCPDVDIHHRQCPGQYAR